MNPTTGWALAGAALLTAYLAYGLPGVALAFTVIVFWLLLQLGRVLRVMRRAGQAPVGSVPSAVMLHARLREGMTMLELLPLAGSLGRAEDGPEPEVYLWQDADGSRVRAVFVNGRLQRWTLERPGQGAAAS